MRWTDLIDKKFGMLTVRALLPGKKCQCDCDCGATGVVKYTQNVAYGKTMSCGCATALWISNARTIHGHARIAVRAPEFRVWTSMLQRCSNPNDPAYSNYGGRGISVCERWRSYSNFIADMGRRPSWARDIDRDDNNGNYEPDNCHWSTRKDNVRNRRVTRMLTYNGETRPLAEWAERIGVTYKTLWLRVRRYGWTAERALGKAA